MVLKPGTGSLALCAGAKSCWKWNLHLHKVGQQQEAWSALKLPGIRLCWPWTSENTVDQHQQMTWHPKPSLTVESTDSSCSPLFVNLPHIFEWVLCHNPLQGAVIPIACTLFSTTSFPSFASLLMCLDTELVNQPLLQWPFVSCPPCARCQWSSFGQLSSQQSSPWLCSLQN